MPSNNLNGTIHEYPILGYFELLCIIMSIKQRDKYMPSKMYSTEYKNFLKLLRTARIEAGYTQADVADIMNKPQSFVSKCEIGERRVDIVELKLFAKIYRKEIEYFIP